MQRRDRSSGAGAEEKRRRSKGPCGTMTHWSASRAAGRSRRSRALTRSPGRCMFHVPSHALLLSSVPFRPHRQGSRRRLWVTSMPRGQYHLLSLPRVDSSRGTPLLWRSRSSADSTRSASRPQTSVRCDDACDGDDEEGAFAILAKMRGGFEDVLPQTTPFRALCELGGSASLGRARAQTEVRNMTCSCRAPV
jgi:hypothetical protein